MAAVERRPVSFRDMTGRQRVRLYLRHIWRESTNPFASWLSEEDWIVYAGRGLWTFLAVTVLFYVLDATGYNENFGMMLAPYCYIAAFLGWGYALFEHYIESQEES